MNSPKLCCHICYQDFNATDRSPRMIPTCGHTFCMNCLSLLLQQSDTNFKCPFDQIEFSPQEKNIDSFPTNLSIKEYVDELSAFDSHENNGKSRSSNISEFTLPWEKISVTENSEAHANRSAEEVKEITIKKTEILERWLKQLHELKENFSQTAKKEKKKITSLVEKQFSELSQLLNQKEKELKSDIQAFWDKRLTLVDSLVGDKSLVKLSINKMITNLQSARRKRDFNKAVQEDPETIPFDFESFQDKLEQITKEMRNTIPVVEEGFRAAEDSLKDIIFLAEVDFVRKKTIFLEPVGSI